LVPGWRELIGRPLPEIVAHQWATTTTILLDDLERIPAERVRAISHADFVAAPQHSIEALARSLDLGWDRQLGEELPLSTMTVSRPDPDKWRRLESLIDPVLPIVEAADARAREFLTRLS
jgi:hypothetical protein